jgi:hypothetical protein
MYQAIVCKLTNVRAHPNADKIKLSTVSGYQIIVGLDAKDGDLGVFFGCDGALSIKHLIENNLLMKKDPETGKNIGGYFSEKGRVKAQKFRGEKSEGFWQPIDAFIWTGPINKLLVEGYQFDTLNGHRICEKYYTPKTLRAMRESSARKGKAKEMTIDRSMLHEHFSTKQIKHNIHMIPEGAILYFTEKLHGTSGRTGRINAQYPFTKWEKFLTSILGRLVKRFNFSKDSAYTEWEYVSGSRTVILDPDIKEDKGYYKGDTFRQRYHEHIKKIGLRKGEILYYELVGHTDSGGFIMPGYKIRDKKLKKMYGEQMYYNYGCESSECKIYIYRITQVTEDGHEIDLSWAQTVARCDELGLKYVPILEDRPYIHTTQEALLKKLQSFADGPSTLDNSHIREGVVVRVEHPGMIDLLKYKGADFCELESIKKNDINFIDPEDVS